MGANDTIQTIKIGIGLDAKELVKSARDAKRELDGAIPPRMERFLTLRAKVDPSLAQVDRVSKDIETRLNQNLKKALQLSPKFTVTGRSVTDLQKAINEGLRAHPITIPVTAAKIDGAKMRAQILEAIGTPSIPFTWHWQGEPPPAGSSPAGGGGGPRSGGPGGRAERRAANQAAHAAQRAAPAAPAPPPAPTAAAPAPLTRPPRPARSRPVAPTAQAPAAAPAASTVVPPGVPQGGAGYTDRRGQADRPSPYQYTGPEMLAQEMEKGTPTRGRVQTRGVRGARLAGINGLTKDEQAALALLQTPEMQAMMSRHRQRAQDIASSINLGNAAARRNDPDFKRARDIVQGLKSGDADRLHKALSSAFGPDVAGSMTTAWERFSLGDLQGAGTMAREARSAIVPFGTQKRIKRKLRRAVDPGSKTDVANAPADVLLFDALASSIMGEETMSENRNARVRKATRRGSKGLGPSTYSAGGGFVGAVAADASYQKALATAMPYLVGHFDPSAPSYEVSEVNPPTGDPEAEEPVRPRPVRERVDARRNRVRSDRSFHQRRVDAAKAQGLSLLDFLQTATGKQMLAEEARYRLERTPGRASGGRVNRFDLDAMRASGQSAESILSQRGSLDPIGEAGGALEWLLKQTVDESGAIKPGLEARSQLLNQLIEKKRGGWRPRARGGHTPKGVYKVGERGTELFVPEQDGWIIPHHLMDQLPKRADGGPVFHGSRGQIIPKSRAERQGWVKGFGEIQRVFVVNFPAVFSAPSTQTAAAAAGGPIRGNVRAPRAGAPAASPAGSGFWMGSASSAGPGTWTAGPGVAGAPPGPTPTGPTPSPGSFSMRAGAFTKQQSRAFATDFADSLVGRMTQARTNVSEAMQLTPARALSVMFGQIAQVGFGGRAGILQRRDVANRAITRSEREISKMTSLREEGMTLRTQRAEAMATPGVDPDVIDALNQRYSENVQARHAQRQRTEKFAAAAVERSTEVVNKRDIVRSAGAGLLGIIGGTVAFTAAMHIVQLGLDEFGKVVDDAADRLSGWSGSLSKASAQLAPAAAQMGGAPRAGLATQFARLGVNGGDFGLLGQFSTRLAGASNLQEVITMMRAENNLRSRVGANARVQAGIGTGFENGPLAAFGLGWIGQTPGALEQLGGALAGGGRGTPLAQLPGILGTIFGNGSMQDTMSGTANSTDPNTRKGAEIVAQNLSTLPIIGGLFGQWRDNLKATDEQAVTFKDNIKLFNDRIYRTIGNAARIQEGASPEQIAASLQAFKDAGNEVAGQRLAQQGLAVVGPGGANASAELVNMVGSAITSLLPSKSELIAAMKPQLSGSLAGIEINAQRQRTDILPTQIALQLGRQPQLAPGTGLTQLGTSPGDAATMKQFVDQVARYQQMSRDLADDSWLAKLPPEAQAAIGQMKQLGTEIAALQTQASNIQATFSADQFVRQQELANRAVGDALGMEGKLAQTVQVVTGFDAQGNKIMGERVIKQTELGRLQREQLMLSRENQRIEFAQSQRQINFNLALAQIQTPGATPAEMAARIANAKTLSQEAQEQLDRQQKMFQLGNQIQDIGISRDAEDAIKALQEMQEGHEVQVTITGIEAAISAAQQAQGEINGFVDSFVGEQQAVDQAITDAWLATETQMNSFQERYNAKIDASLADLTSKYSTFIQTGVAPTSTTTPAVNPYTGFNTNPNSGYIWNQTPAGGHLGATMAPQTGASTVIIQLNNPVIRDESDIDKLARRVEQVMNRRAVAVGVGL